MTQTRAVEKQAQVTGAANNYGLQGNLQANKNAEERKKVAASLIKGKIGVGLVNALAPMANSKSSHDDADEDDHSNKGVPRRRKKTGSVPPITGL